MKLYLLFLFIILTFKIGQSQASFNDGVLEYTSLDGVHVSVKKYNDVCPTGDVVIPSIVEHQGITYTVTTIAEDAFYNCTGLTAIDIPFGVTSIEKRAFYNCSTLKSIEIPQGVTFIEDFTFYKCTDLTSIYIPEGVTTIGKSSFYKSTSISSIALPESLTFIDLAAFYKCSSLLQVTINSQIPPVIESASTFTSDVFLSTLTLNTPNTVSKSLYEQARFWEDFGIINSDTTLSTGFFLSNNSKELAIEVLNDKITVYKSSDVSPAALKLSLYDISGRHIFATTSTTISTLGLPSGIYVLQATIGDATLFKKIVL